MTTKKPKKTKKSGSKKTNPWIDHVNQYRKEHGLSYGDALKKASSSYRKKKDSSKSRFESRYGFLKHVKDALTIRPHQHLCPGPRQETNYVRKVKVHLRKKGYDRILYFGNKTNSNGNKETYMSWHDPVTDECYGLMPLTGLNQQEITPSAVHEYIQKTPAIFDSNLHIDMNMQNAIFYHKSNSNSNWILQDPTQLFETTRV